MPETASDRIHVRKVTDVHANWSEHGTEEPGKFSFQLILDDGAEEYLIRPQAPAAKVLLKLFASASAVFVDTERGAISFHDTAA
jgi:hypothetical protein